MGRAVARRRLVIIRAPPMTLRPLRVVAVILGLCAAAVPANADECEALGLVACGGMGDEPVVCAATCPEERAGELCAALGLVACEGTDGHVCAPECPVETLSPDAACGMLGLTACASEAAGETVCALECPAQNTEPPPPQIGRAHV